MVYSFKNYCILIWTQIGVIHKLCFFCRFAASSNNRIEFSEDQKNLIGLNLNDNLLIRGQAGSGKTTVLAARAGKSLSIASKGSMLFLTYNAALCKYVSKMFKLESASKDVSVLTYHEWAVKMAEAMGYPFGGWVQQRDRTEQIKSILTKAKQIKGTHRL